MAEEIIFPSPTTLLETSTPTPAATKLLSKNDRHASKEARKETVKGTSSKPVNRRAKQSKSRNGCITCKAKRLKCDETKPRCLQCTKRKVECGGYRKDFKWLSFEETEARSIHDRQKKAAAANATVDKANEHQQESSQRPSTQDSHAPEDDPTSASNTAGSLPKPLDGNDNDSNDPGADQLKSDTGSVLPATSGDHSHHVITPNNAIDCRDYVDFSMPDSLGTPSWILSDMPPAGTMRFGEERSPTEDELDRFMAVDYEHGTPPLPSPSYVASPAVSSNHSLSGDMLSISLVHPSPLQHMALGPESDEMLMVRFDRMTCGILSIMDGPTENPWRTLVWPLAAQSPALCHAIMAMTAFHHAADHPQLRLRGHEHKHESLKFIREGISENSIGKQTAIATALALGFAESWDRHIDTGNTHIRGAQALVKSALEDHKRAPLDSTDLQRLKFLCNAWVYMDVIARLTAIHSDNSTDFDNTLLFSHNPPSIVLGNNSPEHQGFGIDFGMPIDARLDPLMGCAGTLFPLIGRVANLVRKVCRSPTNSPATVDTGQVLQEQLEQWTPPSFIVDPEDPTTAPQHALQTAEAYRLATLLHLHQSVPELPSPSTDDLARKVMTHLATVPVKSRIVIVHIFPLMVAGSVATLDEDRQWVRRRWTGMAQRMRIGVIDRCLQVTEEVWRRRDEYAAVPIAQRRLVATAELLPARQRNERLVRRPSERHEVAGRGGMVYSLLGAEEDPVPDPEEMMKLPMSGAMRSGMGRQERLMAGTMDVAYTPRGHAHWVGVMWDWGWEVLLG